ncbi:response regulator [Oceanospirillum beijerinckii]|uniref:response regulator n=1 Tax=Oceanospirillum beijerinckii TaxID=64976 RepID=UPI0003FC3E82|nr:response regulator [Oceanospirillum beijerinckii]
MKKKQPTMPVSQGSEKSATKNYQSLSLRLVLWFLLLSLVPLILVSSLSYQQASDSLVTSAKRELTHSSQLTIRFINNWFDYRFADLHFQAEDASNAQLLQSLSKGLTDSTLSVSQYVNSESWSNRATALQDGLMSLFRRYDYVADIYLIDLEGNILFSSTKGNDFGQNIYTPPIRYTRFASTVKRTLQSGEVLFSDMERYPAPGSPMAGFLTAPLQDTEGKRLGVLAIRLNLDRIFAMLKSGRVENSSIAHYLLAENGVLRTPIENNWDDVLHRKVNTAQYQHFLDSNPLQKLVAGDYLGPDGTRVIGTHNVIHIANVNWILVSEIDRTEALESAHWLGRITLYLVLLTTLVVLILAFVVARRITNPIVKLVNVSKAVAAGETNQQVEIKARDEIGQLADAFNHMLEVKLIQQQALEASRQKSEEALKDLAEQQFAFDQHSIVAITNVRGDITYANDKFAEISGYRQEELIGSNHRILNSGHHSTAFFKEMYQKIARGGVWHGEICNRAKAGHLYWVDTTIVPFKGDDGKPESYIAIRTDVTQRKQAEQAMSEAKEQAEQAAKAKSEFLASMSHEIRTPMNGVLGMLGLLKNTPLNEDQQHKVRIAQSSAESLLTLINDILDFSKVDAGKLELESLDFDLREVLGDFTDSIAIQTQEKGLELILDLSQLDDSGVKGDPTRIRQILTNLVGNAIKFTHKGEIIISASLTPTSNGQLRLNCSVTDTGIGIPKEKISHLFDSFSQVDSSTTRKYGGTGLGLAICKKLCRLMGGDIWVNSQQGKGSSFSFYIIMKKGHSQQHNQPKINFNRLRLLIADSNQTHREILAKQLRLWGASVAEASNGNAVLNVCKQHLADHNTVFDAIFIDSQLSQIAGKDLGMDQRFNQIPLILMHSISDNQHIYKEAGQHFCACIQKPATSSDIMNAIMLTQGEHFQLNDLSVATTGDSKADNHRRHWPEHCRILLVEDNQVNQMVATGILNEIGLDVDIANNGQEALAILQKAPNTYHLILMDCQMPIMDGYVATHKIRNSSPEEGYSHTPIIAMTANAMAGDKEKCLAAGMDDYLSKPIDSSILISILRKWLPEVEQDTNTDKENTKNTDAATQLALADLSQTDSRINSVDATEATSDQPDLVWDQEAVLKRIMGQKELLLALVDAFQIDLPPLLSQLREAINNNDLPLVKFNAHTIKGLAGNLSALELQSHALALEKAAEQHSNQLDQQMKILEQSSDRLNEVLKSFQYQQNNITTDQGGSHELSDLLSCLYTKLESGEYIDPEELTLLRQHNTDPDLRQGLDRLLQQINQFDFVAAISTLREINNHSSLSERTEQTGRKGE